MLGHSLLLWRRFYPRQTMATVISELEEAFAHAGGVPSGVPCHMKAAIIEDQRAEGQKLRENPEVRNFNLR